MGGNTQSKRQVTDAPPSSVESLSEKAIRKGLRSDAMQHPTTILPFALCILSFIYLVLYSPVFGGNLVPVILLIGSGIVAAGSYFWRYSIRYHQEHERRVQEIMELQDGERREREQAELKELRDALQRGFLSVNSIEGLEALNELVHEHEQLQPVLDRRKETDPLSLVYIGTLAEQTYRQGLNMLGGALELTRAIHSSHRENLESEIVELEREIESLRGDETQTARVSMKEETVASHRERLEMIEQQQLSKDKLLHQSDRCEASLARARMELAALKADSSEISVSALTGTLQNTINHTKEVQEELKRLGL